tara:strand:- start:8693 stop:9556 length:864 start_codon:yes stop_codon:yes gene_type:complete
MTLMRDFGCRLTAMLLIWIVGLTALAQAGSLSKQEFAEQRRFAYNNSMFVLYHEVAHLLFDQLDLPVLGREEDAADNLATWTLLNKGSARADRALADSVRGWFLSGVAYDSGGSESDYAAPHILDKQRAYQIVCLMVGKDAVAFRSMANTYHLSRDRQDSCHWDYEMVDRGLLSVLNRHSAKTGPGSDVTVTYHAVGGRLADAADAFKSSGVFDQVADEIRRNYSLREPVQFNAKRCGEANAFYDPDNAEIIFCYELMQDYMDIYAANMPKSAPEAGRMNGNKDKHQ